MKKIALCFTLFLIPLLGLFAESDSNQNYYEANIALNTVKSIDSIDVAKINELAIDLSSMEKNMLYNSNKKSATMPFVLNLFVGFGVGSYVQGDTKGGNIALAGDLLSLSFMVSGYYKALDSISSSTYTGTEGSGLLLVGSLGYLATRIYELIRPFSYSSSYNKKISNALLNVAVVPKLNESNDLEMAVSYKIAL